MNKHILIMDDHALFADGLALILKNLGGDVTVSVANSPHQLLAESNKLLAFDLVLVDLYMPTLSGLSFLNAIKLQGVPVRVAVISGSEDKADIEQALSLGACGFIPKDSISREMLGAVTRLLEGERYLPEHWLGKIDWLDCAELSPNSTLLNITIRQRQVLELIAQGLQNKQIALVMGVSVSAVKGHIEHLFRILGVNNRTKCVQRALEKKAYIECAGILLRKEMPITNRNSQHYCCWL